VHQATADEPDSVWSGGSETHLVSANCDTPWFDPALVLARPFLFIIRDRQMGSILTIGQLVNPGGTPIPPDRIISCLQVLEPVQGSVIGVIVTLPTEVFEPMQGSVIDMIATPPPEVLAP
jgi:hypothetical protein